MYRELGEELGLQPEHVRILGVTKNWLTYFLPTYLRRQAKADRQVCIGQRQKWFLLRLKAPDTAIRLDQTNKPEFLYWRWEDYWYPIEHVVAFKKLVYKKALHELAPLLEEKTAC
jgi:putative (di)nucleoside polyphosphate hydrolase